jgi:hypothetical protein
MISILVRAALPQDSRVHRARQPKETHRLRLTYLHGTMNFQSTPEVLALSGRAVIMYYVLKVRVRP